MKNANASNLHENVNGVLAVKIAAVPLCLLFSVHNNFIEIKRQSSQGSPQRSYWGSVGAVGRSKRLPTALINAFINALYHDRHLARICYAESISIEWAHTGDCVLLILYRYWLKQSYRIIIYVILNVR